MDLDQKSLKYRLIPALLGLAIMIVFFPLTGGEFLNWDDQEYVSGNSFVKNFSERPTDLLKENVMGNYHPVTMLTYGIDSALFGMDPFWFHFTNILLHAITGIILYLLLLRLSIPIWLSALSALLFAFHPMHLEAVAWISGRKDILATLFVFLGIWSYLGSDGKTTLKNWLLVALYFLLALLSKATTVVFPIILILFDLYLGRKIDTQKKIMYGIFLFVSVLFGLMAINAQEETGSVQTLVNSSILDRAAYTSYAFVEYLYKFILPINLSGFSPLPTETSSIHMISLIFWPALIGAAWFGYKKEKWLLLGLGFFILSAILSSPLAGIGKAISAERYTYLAYTGLILMLAIKLSNIKQIQNVVTIYGLVVLSFAYISFDRMDVWKDSYSFWHDVSMKHPEAFIAYNNMGEALLVKNQNQEAKAMFSKAIEMAPNDPFAYNNRAHIYSSEENFESALLDINMAISLDEENDLFYLNRGMLYRSQGKNGRALMDLSKAIELNDRSSIAYNNRGVTYSMLGKFALARKDFNKSIQIDPTYSSAYYNRGTMYYTMTQYSMAVMDFHRTLTIHPDYAPAYHNRSLCSYHLGDFQGALDDAIKAESLGQKVDEKYMEELKSAVAEYGNGLDQ